MDQTEIRKNIKKAIDDLKVDLTEEEKDFIIHNTLYYGKEQIRHGMDSFLKASIYTNAYLKCFEVNFKDMEEDKSTGKMIDVRRIKYGAYRNDLINSALWFGLSMIGSPIEGKRINSDVQITKIREQADFKYYFNAEPDIFSDYYDTFSFIMFSGNTNDIYRFPILYQRVYEDAIGYKYRKLRFECKTPEEFEEKYGIHSKYYKERNKIKIKGGLDNG